MKKQTTPPGKTLFKMHDSQTLLLWSQVFTIEPRKVKESNILSFYIKIRGGDPKLLAKAFNKVLATNDALRLRFVRLGLLQYRQYIDDIRTYEPSHQAVADEAAFEKEYLPSIYQYLLPMTGERLYWAGLVSIGSESVALVMRFHHLVVDGYSIALVFSRIAEAYDQYVQSIEPQPPEYSILRSFEQVRKYKASPKHAEDRSFWMRSFNTQPRYSFPAGRRSELGDCSESEIAIEGLLYQDTIALASRLGCSLQSLIMTVAAFTVYRLTGKTNFCIYSLTHGRFDAIDKKTVGCLMNTVPTFYNLDPARRFDEILQNEYLNFLETLKHGRLSMSEQTPMSYKEAVLHGFNFNHAWLMISAMDFGKTFAKSAYEGRALTAKNQPHQFYGSVLEVPGERIDLVLGYQIKKFKTQQVSQILLTFRDVLSQVTAQPEAALQIVRPAAKRHAKTI